MAGDNIPFDPSSLKKFAGKGKFGIKTQNEVPEDGGVFRPQQDLLITKLNRAKRKASGRFTLPSLFPITGKQVNIFQDALQSIDVDVSLDNTKEYAIDASGFCPELVLSSTNDAPLNVDHMGNNIIVTSSYQANVSLINPRYSFLSPLLSRFYNSFSDTINSFTRAEAIIGTISNAVIEQGVEKFVMEKSYRNKDAVDIHLKLRSPSDSIEKLDLLLQGISELKSVPETVTNLELMHSLCGISSELKSKHKKLSDLIVPESRTMVYPVSSFRYSDAEMSLFYFKMHKPVFIFFVPEQQAGAIDDYFDPEYIILNGNDQSKLINNMLDLGMVDYLAEFVDSVRDTYFDGPKGPAKLLQGIRALAGKQESQLSNEWKYLNEVAQTLRITNAADILSRTSAEYSARANTRDLESVRGQYIRSLDPMVKSKIIFPAVDGDDILICELISTGSQSDALKLYQDTNRFMTEFSSAGDDSKISMLKDIDKSMFFESQNNRLVNYWLSKQYADVCKKAGISFSAL